MLISVVSPGISGNRTAGLAEGLTAAADIRATMSATGRRDSIDTNLVTLMNADQYRVLVTGQLNGGRSSIRRDATPAARHTRASQSVSSSVTRFPITRTAIFIRNDERMASGPVNGRNRGIVSSNPSRRAA